jgi:hypothetical protein
MQNQVDQTPNSSKLAEILLQLRAVPSANSDAMPAAEAGAMAFGTEEVKKNILAATLASLPATDFHIRTTTTRTSSHPLAQQRKQEQELLSTMLLQQQQQQLLQQQQQQQQQQQPAAAQEVDSCNCKKSKCLKL